MSEQSSVEELGFGSSFILKSLGSVTRVLVTALWSGLLFPKAHAHILIVASEVVANTSSLTSSFATFLSRLVSINISPVLTHTAVFALLPRIPSPKIFAGHMSSFALGFYQSLVIREAVSRP